MMIKTEECVFYECDQCGEYVNMEERSVDFVWYDPRRDVYYCPECALYVGLRW